MARNILFIMCDQLRFDYLSCYGHPHLETPNIDRLAARGRALRTAPMSSRPICGPSRMSFYTGRYVRSPRLDLERLSAAGRRADAGRPSAPARHAQRAGRQDPHGGRPRGHGAARHRPGLDHRRPRRRMRLRALRARRRPPSRRAHDRRSRLQPRSAASSATTTANPWDSCANAGLGDDGEMLSGWLLQNADRPARIAEEHSETPYMTTARHRLHRQAGDDALVPASVLHQAALALYRAGALPRHVRPRGRPAGDRARTRSASDPHPVYAGVHGPRARASAFAPRRGPRAR